MRTTSVDVITTTDLQDVMFRIAPWLVFQAAVEVVVLSEASIEVVQPQTVHHKVVVVDASEVA